MVLRKNMLLLCAAVVALASSSTAFVNVPVAGSSFTCKAPSPRLLARRPLKQNQQQLQQPWQHQHQQQWRRSRVVQSMSVAPLASSTLASSTLVVAGVMEMAQGFVNGGGLLLIPMLGALALVGVIGLVILWAAQPTVRDEDDD